MPKEKNKNKNEDEILEEVNISEEESSLAEFTKRSLPTEKEVEDFDRALKEEINEEEKEEEVDSSLSEIYQDDEGQMVDVKKMYRKKRHGLLYWFFVLFFSSLLIFSSVFYFYENYYLETGTDATAVEFSIRSETEVVAGEEFYYEINYKNLSNVKLHDSMIELAYPENFIFIESEPAPNEGKNNIWSIGTISEQHIGKLKIKGKIVGYRDSVNVLLAGIEYMPENFSSRFSKDSSISTIIKSTGVDIELDYIPTALVGEDNEVLIKYSAENENYINDFRIIFEQQENIEIKDFSTVGGDENRHADFETIRPGVWRVNEVLSATRELSFKFDFEEKLTDRQEITFIFEKREGDDYIEFLRKQADFEVMNSDLNLNLIINGSRGDHGIPAGETLNYSIVYNNKGETDMKNVVIMAVLNGDYLDWSTLEDESNGKLSGSSISWTKEEIPKLESLEKHQEGIIDFSIRVKDIDDIIAIGEGVGYKIKSYVQFSVGESSEAEEKPEDENQDDESIDKRSNIIISSINSDLSIEESVRYFSKDNNTVGFGPHPPEVGKETRYRVYWELSNNLHELGDLKITTELPQGIEWAGRDMVSVGTIVYDDISRKVVWNIGRLPASINKTNAYFDIAINPKEEDKDKIMILLSGTSAVAVDQETKEELVYKTKVKTTKLSDDEIAVGDGVVR